MKKINFILIISITVILFALLLINSPSSSSNSRNHHDDQFTSSIGFQIPSLIKNACPETRYAALCRSTLSNITASKKSVSFQNILEFTINRTAQHVNETRIGINSHFKNQDLNSQEKNALQDCMEMLDQTSYELKQVIENLWSRASFLHRSYGNIKNLLSAAMTNENTCIVGFLDLEQFDDTDTQTRHTKHLQNLLNPISQMISNSLALIKHVENKDSPEMLKKQKVSVKIAQRRKKPILHWRPYVTVASDGSGNYRTIGEAIAMAPNMSMTIYVIKIKAGTYEENVMIPREKTNIMLIGDGMNSTIITGSRNFIDGFSTFASATLTVMGDKFLARDLTVRNTSPPEKHQAVALMVTSNAAFNRCEIISHQDTLYAHSLRQFYHNCTIQGTVDFIFGNAAAVFRNCKILVRKPNIGQRNMITAQGRDDPNQNTGIILQNCTIEAAKEFNLMDRNNFSTYLGRPWRNYSRTVVMDSYLGDLIHPRGWCQWNVYSSLDTVEYIEYMNFGPGANTTERVSWPGYRKNCSENVVRQFTVEGFLHGADDWLDSTVFRLFGRS